jgi:hypothetical protein
MTELERSTLHANTAAIAELSKVISLIIAKADLSLYEERKAAIIKMLDGLVVQSQQLSTPAANEPG